MSLWEIEENCWAEGHTLVCGVDEAGAGPLAGPVYAAAVILPRHVELKWLDDSKQVTPKRREVLFDAITECAEAWAIAAVHPKAIDETDILTARMRAMELAIRDLNPAPDLALVDGNRDKGRGAAITVPHRCIVKGDSLSASIAAASILAKVSRDRYMVQQDKLYPQYGFAQHKGYPTKAHYDAIRQFGPSPIHRMTFLKKFYAQEGLQ